MESKVVVWGPYRVASMQRAARHPDVENPMQMAASKRRYVRNGGEVHEYRKGNIGKRRQSNCNTTDIASRGRVQI